MASQNELGRLRDLVSYFEGRKLRAKERLSADIGHKWCFALVGFNIEVEEFKMEDFAVIRSVIEPPGEVELARALKEKHLWSAVGRYSKDIKYELTISSEAAETAQFAFTLAWWITSAIRIRSQTDFLIPAVADHSWSTIAALEDATCSIQILEDVPQARRIDTTRVIREEDLTWAIDNLTHFASLLEMPKFRLAVESLSTHHFQSSERMMTAQLWSGIEALFEIQSELRFRLSAVIASILEPRGEQRIAQYRLVKKLYDVRSKAVHGGAIDNKKLMAHIKETRQILAALICKFTEMEHVPNEVELDTYLFS